MIGNIWTLYVRILNKVNQQTEQTVFAAEHNIDIICQQENRYDYSEIEIKYHYTSKGSTFFSASA